jgi:hypothetical protein
LDPDSADTVKHRSALSGEGEDFVDAKTDLIPGHYEGGLKTWEGGVDLVEVLAGVQGGVGEWVRGSKVLEVGSRVLRDFLPSQLCPGPVIVWSGCAASKLLWRSDEAKREEQSNLRAMDHEGVWCLVLGVWCLVFGVWSMPG